MAYSNGGKITRLAIVGGAAAVKAVAAGLGSRNVLVLINDDVVAQPFFYDYVSTVNSTTNQGRPIGPGKDSDIRPLGAAVDVWVYSDVNQTITIEELSA